MRKYQSWGRYPRATAATVQPLYWQPTQLPAVTGTGLLAYGLGRSQGDSCLNDGGTLLDTSHLNRFINFDAQSGIIRVEAGVTLAQIQELVVPRGWFLPVTPGTKHVTVGGAIANDVHGKNELTAGAFGRFITAFELLRSDGKKYLCSTTQQPELFNATIGGLGLTGLITWAELRLKKASSAWMDVEHIPFNTLAELLEKFTEYSKKYEYLVAQINGVHKNISRGVLMCGNHAKAPVKSSAKLKKPLTIPFTAPNWLLNPMSMALYFRWYELQNRRPLKKVVHYDPYFYPLDSISNWHELYGSRGFLQYQCVIPHEHASVVISRILQELRSQKIYSYLTSVKIFGDQPSPGLLSFPRPGICIALDLPNIGEKLLGQLDIFDTWVRESGGAVYPAKDARMSAESFKAYFPRWHEFSQHIDPAFSSSFWRRVTAS